MYLNWGPTLPKLFVEIKKQYLLEIYADYCCIQVIRFDSENNELADYSLFKYRLFGMWKVLENSENHSVRMMGK